MKSKMTDTQVFNKKEIQLAICTIYDKDISHSVSVHNWETYAYWIKNYDTLNEAMERFKRIKARLERVYQ